MRVAVIGANAAGAAAVTSLRRLGFGGQIDLFDSDPNWNCERPPLSKQVLLEAVEPDSFNLIDVDSLGPSTTVHCTFVERLAPNPLTLHCKNGIRLVTDGVLIATGSKAIDLPAPTDGSIPATTLRTWTDAETLSQALPDKRILVVGGGVIGCEVAAAASKCSKNVSLVELSDRLMGRAFDQRVGKKAFQALSTRGVDIFLSNGVKRIANGTAILADGGRVECDHIITGIGARPNIELAVRCGIHCEQGILVDGRQQTSMPGVFAAGDVAEGPFGWNGALLRHEAQISAQQQGEAAAHAIMGVRYRDCMPFFWSDQGDGRYAQVGWRTDEATRQHRSTDTGEMVFHCQDDTLIGATVIDTPTAIPALRRLVAQPLDRLVGLQDPNVSLRDIVRDLRTAA